MPAKSTKRVRLLTAICPLCCEKGGLKKIIFGMPNSDFDFEKYIVGGCCVTDNDPEIGCVKCGWKGLRLELLMNNSNQD